MNPISLPGALALLTDEFDLTTILILSGLKFVTVILGLTIVFFGAKAYLATRRKNMLWFTVGIGVMTIGAIAEGLAYQGLQMSLDQAHVVEGVFTLAAFGILVYSLFA